MLESFHGSTYGTKTTPNTAGGRPQDLGFPLLFPWLEGGKSHQKPGFLFPGRGRRGWIAFCFPIPPGQMLWGPKALPYSLKKVGAGGVLFGMGSPSVGFVGAVQKLSEGAGGGRRQQGGRGTKKAFSG